MRDHLERDGFPRRVEHDLRGRHFQPLEPSGLRHSLRTTVDPAHEHPVRPGINLHPLAPLVGVQERRLGEDLAGLSVLDIDAPGFLVKKGVMIGLEVVAEEREPEAAAALERAVARPGVAPEPAHQRQHMALKVGGLLDVLDRKPLRGGRDQGGGGRLVLLFVGPGRHRGPRQSEESGKRGDS